MSWVNENKQMFAYELKELADRLVSEDATEKKRIEQGTEDGQE